MNTRILDRAYRIAAQAVALLVSREKKPEKDVRRPAPRPQPALLLNRVFRFGVLSAFFLCLSSESIEAKDVTYKGRATGQVVESIPLADPEPGGVPFLFERAEAKGNFTHVGQSTIWLAWFVSAEEVDGELFFVIEGVFVLASAKGERLWGKFLALQNASSAESEIEVRVEGGTGRFRNASGVILGTGLRNGNVFSYELDGELSY